MLELRVEATSLILICPREGTEDSRAAKPLPLLSFILCSFLLRSRVLDQLPAANRLLLQHLLCVLHHILLSADTNKMDAHNLAVCIGPTLLQLDGAPLSEQKDRIEKVGPPLWL